MLGNHLLGSFSLEKLENVIPPHAGGGLWLVFFRNKGAVVLLIKE